MKDRNFSRIRSDVPFSVTRSEGGPSVLEGYAAVFNQATDLYWFTESIAPGAFSDSLSRDDDVIALFNHNPDHVLARKSAGSLVLAEDEHGLKIEMTPVNTNLGRDVVELISARAITQMSFQFTIDEETRTPARDGGKDHYTIERATLIDVSPVTFPAYKGTEIDLQRQAELRAKSFAEISGRDAIALFEARKRQINILLWRL